MNIVVIGCTESTRHVVDEVVKNREHKIVGIFSLEDKYSYQKSRFALLDDIAHQNDIKLYKIERINEPKAIRSIKGLDPDLILESGWSQIISKDVLEIPHKGSIGLHYSLLPKNQGAASLNWALIRGENKWGVTLFYLQEKADEGDIIDQREFAIDWRDNIKTLYDKADLSATEMIRDNLPLIKEGRASRKRQNKQEATYLPIRSAEDGEIDWTKSNIEIYNLVRAITKPYPGAFTFFGDKKVFVWQADVIDGGDEKPGFIIKILDGKGIVVGAGAGKVLVKRAQFEDSIEMWADDLAKKYGVKTADEFH